MDQLEILRILTKYNPWWENKPIPESKTSPFFRGDFYIIKELLTKKEINSIIGPRRVGKTILMHQLIGFLLKSGADPKSILYLSLDEIELIKGGADFKDIIEVYSKYIIQKSLDSLSNTHYLFLDEIQELEDWAKILKNWYDFGYKLKFIISGSSSIWINKGTEESLLGRIKTSIMLPLKFSEVIKYRAIFSEDFFKTKKEVQDALLQTIYTNDINVFKNSLNKLIAHVSSKKGLIELELNKYIIAGGYPEFLSEQEYRRISESIKDKIKLIFYKDIVRYFRIRNPSVLENLFELLAKNSGGLLNVVDTAQLLDIERPTVRDYLKYLTKAFLIQPSEFYSSSRKVRIRKQQKIYVLDPGIRNGVTDFLDETLLKNDVELGLVVEGILFDHLCRLSYNLEPKPEPKTFYWRDKKEIDFVITIKRKPIPFESKFRNKTPEESINAIKDFLEENKSPIGFIITKDIFDTTGNIMKIPLWLFLLII